MTKTINRETSDTYIGFPFQRARTAYIILKLFNENKDFIVVPEYKDDIFIDNGEAEIVEQDKRSSSSKYTINSEAIYKTMVNFLDCYFQDDKDPLLKFCFYTNTEFTKERSSEFKEPLLKSMCNKNFSDEVLVVIKDKIIFRYEELYSANTKMEGTGYLEKIKKMTLDDWKVFLEKIEFIFGGSDYDQIKVDTIKLIKEADAYTPMHNEREEDILNAVNILVDEKMAETKLFRRLIYNYNIQEIYRKRLTENKTKTKDKVNLSLLKGIEKTRDINRNLQSKIEAVCSDFNRRSLFLYQMESATAISDLEQLSLNEADILKVRIYMAMFKFLDKKIQKNNAFSEEELKKIVDEMKKYTIGEMNDLKKDYIYAYNNDTIIEGMTLMLIDQCYHSFEH